MKKVMKFRYRILALLVLAVVLSAATYGFAAANTIDATVAGEGEAAISGYDATNIVYTLDVSDPTLFASVSFDLDASATDVYVGLGDGAVPEDIDWYSCPAGPASSFTCLLPNASVRRALSLHISAVQ